MVVINHTRGLCHFSPEIVLKIGAFSLECQFVHGNNAARTLHWRSLTCVGAVDDQGFDDVDVPVLAGDVERGASARVPDLHLEEVNTPVQPWGETISQWSSYSMIVPPHSMRRSLGGIL